MNHISKLDTVSLYEAILNVEPIAKQEVWAECFEPDAPAVIIEEDSIDTLGWVYIGDGKSLEEYKNSYANGDRRLEEIWARSYVFNYWNEE